jgi:excinuclease ABC subunit A
VRTHNLKGIDLDLPLGRMIAITGVSGAGKSSLAFDTLYAEGQRRYVETFSAYARQFLEPLEKPDAERIERIPPAIAVAGRETLPSARSTVGTISEVHDYLALLFARAGVVLCRACGAPVSPATPSSISGAIEKLPEGARYEIAFPLELLPDTDVASVVRTLIEDGLTRARVAGQLVELPAADPALMHQAVNRGEDKVAVLDVIVDRLARGKDAPQRRLDSIETALARGLGRCRLLLDSDALTFVRGWRCARCGTDHIAPQLKLFRYNSPLGACPRCEGVGRVAEPNAGHEPGAPVPGPKGARSSRGKPSRTCPDCGGTRLRPEALAVRFEGMNIAELSALSIGEARRRLAGSQESRRQPVAARLLEQIERRLDYLEQIGLEYLSLDRPGRSLSGGELRRVTMTQTLCTGLVNTLYVLDEPTAGLHPSEVSRLIAILHHLRDAGNTLVIVEHDHPLIRASDHVIDLGPGAGEAGGQVLHAGPVESLVDVRGSLTADFLSGRKRVEIPPTRRQPSRGCLTIAGASGHNLKGIEVSFPLGVLCLVTGVSGSGKSTLVEETLYPALRNRLHRESMPTAPFGGLTGAGEVDDVVFLDQAPIGRSGRSNPATFLKVFDEIRRTFAATHEARLRNYGAGMFSFNVEGGRCGTCKGDGYLLIDMQFLPDVMMRCPDCRGTRYRPELLEITYRGRNIAEVLELSAREAFVFFRHRPKIQSRLRPMLDIGLDYLRLGQPAATLSGGEAQRLKLAGFLGGSTAALNRAGNISPTLFLLDEPTAGLHPFDVLRLIDALNALVDRGHSVIAIEHNPGMMLCADWIVDLGPRAGAEGGRVVAQGTPEELAASGTLTGSVIAGALEGRSSGARP